MPLCGRQISADLQGGKGKIMENKGSSRAGFRSTVSGRRLGAAGRALLLPSQALHASSPRGRAKEEGLRGAPYLSACGRASSRRYSTMPATAGRYMHSPTMNASFGKIL